MRKEIKFGIIGGIIIIIGVSAFYLASPLFISTEINEPLPEGAEIHPTPTPPDFVNLGRLKANIGNQNYPIPDGTDMTKYDTVLIWCRAFSVLFGSAELKPVIQ